MRILFVTSRVPYPPHRGDKLRTYNFLRILAASHDVRLLTFSDASEEFREAQRALEQLGVSVHTVWFPPWYSWLRAALLYPLPFPSQLMYYASLRMARAIRSVTLATPPDLVYFHLFRMAPYRRWVVGNPYTVIDMTDVISKELFRSIPYRRSFMVSLIAREARRIRKYERWITQHADETWVISDADKDDVEAIGKQGRVVVIPNGLPMSRSVQERSPDPATVLFYGYASVLHNRDALSLLVQHILPHVQRTVPTLRLVVTGAGKHAAHARQFSRHIPVTFEGFLNDPSSMFARATVMVAPVRFSAGTQNKILEAMAAGVPIITSPFGNEGIGGQDGEHLALCRTPEEFAQRILWYLGHPEEREAMGKRGQLFAQQHFSWDTVQKRVNEIEKHLGPKPHTFSAAVRPTAS